MGEDKELELFVTYPNGEEKPLDKGSLSYTICMGCSRIVKSIELLREAVFALDCFNYEVYRFLEGKMKTSKKHPYKAKQILKMLK